MMRAPVYVDFDDVLCESARTLARISGERYGKPVAFEEIYSFDLNQSFGLDASEQVDLFTLFHDAEMLYAIPPIPDAIAGMQTWAAAGCRIEIVTGRPPVTQAVCCEWLDAYKVPYDGITFVDKYRRGHGPVAGVRQMTLEQIAACTFALAVDDSPEMIECLAVKTGWPLALFDRPWNQQLAVGTLRPGTGRYAGWRELLDAYPAPGVM
ncbi:MAG: 5' nucleotidase, NT5C type [Kiritimatiellia bacterium]